MLNRKFNIIYEKEHEMDKVKEIFEKFKGLPWGIICLGIGAVLVTGVILDLLGVASVYGINEAIEANLNE